MTCDGEGRFPGSFTYQDPQTHSVLLKQMMVIMLQHIFSVTLMKDTAEWI